MIRSLHAALRGQAVDVGGRIIHVDADGVVSDADPDIEAHLLEQPHNWQTVDTVSVVPSTSDAAGTVRQDVVPVKRGRTGKRDVRELETLQK